MKSLLTAFVLSTALMTAPVFPVQASDSEGNNTDSLLDETAETASEVGSALKDWGSKVWDAGKDAAASAGESLDETDSETIGDTLKSWGSSLWEGGQRAADAAKEKMDEFSDQQEGEEPPADPETKGIAI